MHHRNGRVAVWLAQRRRLAVPSLFFLAVIYYEELAAKLLCFHALSPQGALFTLLFTLPIALLLGLVCGGVSPKKGRVLLPLCTLLVSAWLGSQMVYYRLFKTFLTIFSLTKMGMVAGAFGSMATTDILVNWFPILVVAVPVVLAVVLRKRMISDGPAPRKGRLHWLMLAAGCQAAAMVLVLLCGGGVLSLRYIYYFTATPEQEMQNFGVFTQTQLELRRVIFGIKPDAPDSADTSADRSEEAVSGTHTLPIDFAALEAQAEEDGEEELLEMHHWFAQRQPAAENEWTGRFRGKNLVWIVAEAFSTSVLDPARTPTLWKLAHQGIVCDHFYTPLWGVSTSDGEYVTTTSLIPKSGVWSYSQSSENYMPFSLGHQFRKQGYTTLAYHNYLYTYYDRDKSHPNMGYDYRAVGQGLDWEDVVPAGYLNQGRSFAPSDRMMMQKIVPEFVREDHFMVYCLTVSGHLNYTREENIMADFHWNEVKDLPYGDEAKCYLASQMELELALRSLIRQLKQAGKLDDTVIVLSADHYPYGLTDDQYSELVGHPIDPVFQRYENSLILWSADMDTPVHVDKYCSSLDLLPTLSNLFGLEYDSRLMMGSDILSDQDELVIFSNYSFLCGAGYYNAVTDQFTRWDGQAPDPDQVAALVTEVQNRVAYSAAVLDLDYYRLALHDPPRTEEETERHRLREVVS